MSKRKSKAWNHFQKIDKDEAKCFDCGARLSCKGGNTTGLINHLKLHGVHINISNSYKLNSEASTSKHSKSSTSLITSFIKKESLNEILSKCAAKDGFSFNAIVHSEAIRGYVASRQYSMPRSCSTIRKNILEFFEEKKIETKNELLRLLNLKKKFSISVDEWTDVSMRRYLNVTLRSSNSQQFVLGLVTIKEKCTAEKTKELVENILREFGVSLRKDIVASTNDGASVMVKYCSLITPEKQLCYNHAIHLAVLKVLYKKVNTEDIANVENNDEDELVCEDEGDEQEDDENLVMVEGSENHVLISDIKPALYEMRKLIKFFKNSSIRTEILLKHVRQKEGHELKLILDVPTRWNSLAQSINRFLKLINCINKALDELGLQSFNENYIDVLKNLSATLEPTVLAVEQLSKDSANLLIAEAIILYVLQRLKQINTNFSQNLFEILKNEIEKRRHKELLSLLLFLHHGTFAKQNENDLLNYSSKFITKNFAKQLFHRLFLEEGYNQESESDEEPEIEIEHDECTEHYNLQKSIESLTKLKSPKSSFNIDKEFRFIEGNDGKRSINMNNLYEALLSISPTSTSAERVFSIVGNTVNKVRSRLGTNTVSALVFLKYYFNKNN